MKSYNQRSIVKSCASNLSSLEGYTRTEVESSIAGYNHVNRPGSKKQSLDSPSAHFVRASYQYSDFKPPRLFNTEIKRDSRNRNISALTDSKRVSVQMSALEDEFATCQNCGGRFP